MFAEYRAGAERGNRFALDGQNSLVSFIPGIGDRETFWAQRIDEIVRGKRGISSDTAWRLAQALDTTPEFWLNLQATFDLAVNKPGKTVPKLKKAS